MYCFTLSILLDVRAPLIADKKYYTLWFHKHLSSSFSSTIVARHTRQVRFLHADMNFNKLSIITFCDALFHISYPSRRAPLIDNKTYYTFWFHNDLSSSFSATIVARRTRLVTLSMIYLWVCNSMSIGASFREMVSNHSPIREVLDYDKDLAIISLLHRLYTHNISLGGLSASTVPHYCRRWGMIHKLHTA